MPERELKKKEHQVFISYCNENNDKAGSDREIADRICSALESANIRCWIDHRDITPGENWMNAMFNAVERSKLMVLVFSENANRSQWVQDEIAYALDQKKRIIPFRLDNVSPEGTLRVLKVRCHWIDARQPLQQEDLNRLVESVRNYLEKDKAAETVTITEPPLKVSRGHNVGDEKDFENYLSLAMDDYINENYEKALENILKAEKIKNNDKVCNLKEKIQGKISVKKERKQTEVGKKQPGIRETDYGDGIIMVSIPAGEFVMGSNEYDNEKPPHTVYLDEYRMGKYEVTIKQFRLFVEDTGYVTQAESSGGAYGFIEGNWRQDKNLNWKNPGFDQEDSHPVVCISWNDALKYCQWLSGKVGVNFKLPTEARWEKAARGTDGRKYPWGDQQPDEKLANFGGNIFKTTRVGSYSKGASPYGLLDMAGNVWEWCNDWYDENYYRSSPGKNPEGPKSRSYRVMRGGSWSRNARYLRCASRFNGRPSLRSNRVGFRLCQDN